MAFQRLSTVPTVPELLRQAARERAAKRSRPGRAYRAWPGRAGVAACLAGAAGVLAMARLLNACRLFSPSGIGALLSCADRLARAGMGKWRSGRATRWT